MKNYEYYVIHHYSKNGDYIGKPSCGNFKTIKEAEKYIIDDKKKWENKMQNTEGYTKECAEYWFNIINKIVKVVTSEKIVKTI